MRPKLTIGMACYDDMAGLWPTLQSLRLHHARALPDCELIVVDNHPGSRDGEAIRNYFGQWFFAEEQPASADGWMRGRDWAWVKYLPYAEPVGTTMPREMVFRHARGDAVLCMDSHVLLGQGALERLLRFYDTYRGNDLLSGPLLYDDARQHATHFQDVWRDQMWGTWGTAWVCPCGQLLDMIEEGGQTAWCELVNNLPLYRCPGCKNGLPRLAWAGHERQLLLAGFARAADDPDREPFEVPAMGLGLFTCRRYAWLGFNERFRGFGGEEWYIHEKFRKAGHRCLCLPWLRWNHRFWRPAGATYEVSLYNKLRNYVIGHTELGLPLDRVKEHFWPLPAVRNDWEALTRDPANPPEQQAFQQQQAGSCGSCGQAAIPDTLDLWYQEASTKASDINEHCATLKTLAAQSAIVVDMGMRHNVSTVALLAGQPQRLITCYPGSIGVAQGLKQHQQRTQWEHLQSDSLSAEIPEADLLFIDTQHNADRFYAELVRYAPKVRRWIVRHDTEVYGETGEGGGPGLLPAVRRFVQEHQEWTVVRRDVHNNGLLVLSRDERDKQQPPGLLRKALNFAQALAAHATAGQRLALPMTFEERTAKCLLCPKRHFDTCGECGCPIAAKCSWAEQACPKNPPEWGPESVAKEAA